VSACESECLYIYLQISEVCLNVGMVALPSDLNFLPFLPNRNMNTGVLCQPNWAQAQGVPFSFQYDPMRDVRGASKRSLNYRWFSVSISSPGMPSELWVRSIISRIGWY